MPLIYQAKEFPIFWPKVVQEELQDLQKQQTYTMSTWEPHIHYPPRRKENLQRGSLKREFNTLYSDLAALVDSTVNHL